MALRAHWLHAAQRRSTMALAVATHRAVCDGVGGPEGGRAEAAAGGIRHYTDSPGNREGTVVAACDHWRGL